MKREYTDGRHMRGMDALMERITLKTDNGGEIDFRGYPYAKSSYFDEQSGELTTQELYAAGAGEQAFSIAVTDGRRKSKRAYFMKKENDTCRMFDGEREMSLPMDSIMAFARTLIDLENERRVLLEGAEEPMSAIIGD